MYRVIVADDEKSIRNGIVCLIDWKSIDCQIVCECENGKQVLEFLTNQEADIVVSDIKMPVMDGLKLAEIIHKQYGGIKVILLTAYSDFNFAKEALLYGVSDYIVKNEFITKLPEAIQRVSARLVEEKQRRINQKSNEKKMKAYILEAVVLNKLIPIEDGIILYGLEAKNYCVCRCEFTYEEGEESRPNNMQAIENFFNAAVGGFEHYLINRSSEGMTIIFCADNDIKYEVKNIVIIMSEITRIAEEFMRLNIKIGVSSICSIVQLEQAYEEAGKALYSIASSGNEIIVYGGEVKGEEKESYIGYRNESVHLLFEKDFESADKQLQLMKQCIVSAQLKREEMQAAIINFCSMVFRNIDQRCIMEDAQSLESDIYNRLYTKESMYTLLKVCDEVMEQAKKIIEVSLTDKHYLVVAMDEYIHRNYCQSIALQEISDQLHISPSYASKLYKKKTGTTLTNAINKQRIKKAKELLTGSTYKIYEIAQMVGIEDAGYFTNLFIKYEGCSPSEYRGIAPEDEKSK